MHIDINQLSALQQLAPQEQLAVSLYMKSMNKAQASRDAGYSSASVFNKPLVQAAIGEQMRIRAERLRLGADWVLMELKKCYDTTVGLGEMRNALQALNLIGKHVDISAWEKDGEKMASDHHIVERLVRAKARNRDSNSQLPPPPESIAPPVSFLEPLIPQPESIVDESDEAAPDPVEECLDPAVQKQALLERLRSR